MPGATASFESAPEARRYLAVEGSDGLTSLGPAKNGFWRFRLAL